MIQNPRDARLGQDESLVLTGAMVEVESPFSGAAIKATRCRLDAFEEASLTRNVAARPLRVLRTPAWIGSVLGVALPLSRLVPFPCLRRIVGFAAGHMGIVQPLPEDTWGNEALEHVQLGQEPPAA